MRRLLDILRQKALSQILWVDLIYAAAGLHVCKIATRVIGASFTTTLLLVEVVKINLFALALRWKSTPAAERAIMAIVNDVDRLLWVVSRG